MKYRWRVKRRKSEIGKSCYLASLSHFLHMKISVYHSNEQIRVSIVNIASMVFRINESKHYFTVTERQEGRFSLSGRVNFLSFARTKLKMPLFFKNYRFPTRLSIIFLHWKLDRYFKKGVWFSSLVQSQ